MKTFRPFDFILFFSSLFCGVFLTVKGMNTKGNKIRVNAGGTEYEYSAASDGTYTVEGTLGKTTFEIKDKKVRIIDSPCQNKTCIKQGFHTPLVCLPNNVIITVISGHENRDFDAISE